MFAFAVYKFGAFLAQRFSLPTARRLAAVVGRLMCLLQRRNRRHLLRNLEVAFGDVRSARELRQLRLAIFANFATVVADFLWLPKINRENIADLVTPETMQTFENLKTLMKEKGAVIHLSAHLGNWELAGVTAALAGLPLTELVDAHPSPLVTRFFNARREEKGLGVVPVSAFRRCFRILRERKLLAIAGDRAVTGQGILMPYFGTPAIVPDGHAALARRFGAVIVPGFLIKRDDGRYDFLTNDIIEPRTTDDIEGDIRDCVERCLRVFEQRIAEHPEQWYVFRPIWDTEGAVRKDRLRAREERLRARETRLEARRQRRKASEERAQARREELSTRRGYAGPPDGRSAARRRTRGEDS
jgi:lauroyl/myristoyl acyltransferase